MERLRKYLKAIFGLIPATESSLMGMNTLFLIAAATVGLAMTVSYTQAADHWLVRNRLVPRGFQRRHRKCHSLFRRRRQGSHWTNEKRKQALGIQ
jgi:hypothetical protein